MAEVLSIVLGGGKGTRLFPLTKERAKPAVPFGGKYRIVDIPISNCINSGFRKSIFSHNSILHHFISISIVPIISTASQRDLLRFLPQSRRQCIRAGMRARQMQSEKPYSL